MMARRGSRAYMRRRRNTIKYIVIACSLAVIVSVAGILTTNLTLKFSNNHVETSSNVIEVPEKKEVTVVMVGDNLLHMPLINDAKTENETYNFDGLYEELGAYFRDADLSVIVQETILGGKDLGYSGYPAFNSPQEVGDALDRAGFDIVLSATNHCLDKGAKGIENTLESWKDHPQVTVLGINATEEDYNTVRYVEKNGIKFAVLNYTDSTNGIPTPNDKEYLVNRVDRDKMAQDLDIAEKNADFTIVFMHWGTEYRLTANDDQKELAAFMTEHGADLIMGSHPHVIEPVEWVETENGNRALVYYSLGNYVSRQKEARNLLGALAEVTICSDGEKGTYIASASVMGTVTHYDKNSRNFRVYSLNEYTDELASQHGVAQYDGKVTVERFRKTYDEVFGGNTAVTVK